MSTFGSHNLPAAADFAPTQLIDQASAPDHENGLKEPSQNQNNEQLEERDVEREDDENNQAAHDPAPMSTGSAPAPT